MTEHAVTVTYGPNVPTETELRLCGPLSGKRTIELGVGGATNLVALARQGAKVIGVDPSGERIAAARRVVESEGVRVEFHQGDYADLGFATSGSVDLVLSAMALDDEHDLPRLFRQVHRVLRPGAPFVLSLSHPIAAMVDAEGVLRRPYHAAGMRTTSGLFTALSRANFHVDVLLEPPRTDDRSALVPAAVVLRARKVGA